MHTPGMIPKLFEP